MPRKLPKGSGGSNAEPSGATFTGRGGALDFYCHSHRALYPRLNKTQFTFELSDHLPLWVEVG